MVAVGMLMTWLGYSLGLEGWCLFRDYNVTLGQLMSPLHPYNGKWPPAALPSSQIWPGTPAPSTSTTAAPAASSSPAAKAAHGFNLGGAIQNVIKYIPGIGPIK